MEAGKGKSGDLAGTKEWRGFSEFCRPRRGCFDSFQLHALLPHGDLHT
jgi:hypothetical protein